MTKARIVACPVCGNAVEWTTESRWRPFCSKRCKTIDLGAWAAEEYRAPIAEPPDPDALSAAFDDARRRQDPDD